MKARYARQIRSGIIAGRLFALADYPVSLVVAVALIYTELENRAIRRTYARGLLRQDARIRAQYKGGFQDLS